LLAEQVGEAVFGQSGEYRSQPVGPLGMARACVVIEAGLVGDQGYGHATQV
jgi:hypothetical protein